MSTGDVGHRVADLNTTVKLGGRQEVTSPENSDRRVDVCQQLIRRTRTRFTSVLAANFVDQVRRECSDHLSDDDVVAVFFRTVGRKRACRGRIESRFTGRDTVEGLVGGKIVTNVEAVCVVYVPVDLTEGCVGIVRCLILDLVTAVEIVNCSLSGIDRSCDSDEILEQNLTRSTKTLLFVRCKVEQLVLLDRAADRTAELMLGRCERCLNTESVQTLISECLGKLVADGQLLGAKQVKQGSANFVRTRLGHCVDDTARTAAELSRVTCGDNLEFANRFLRDGERRI